MHFRGVSRKHIFDRFGPFGGILCVSASSFYAYSSFPLFPAYPVQFSSSVPVQYMCFCVVFSRVDFLFGIFGCRVRGVLSRCPKCILRAYFFFLDIPFVLLGFGGVWIVSRGVVMSFLHFYHPGAFSFFFSFLFYCFSLWGRRVSWVVSFGSTVLIVFEGFSVVLS